MTRAQKKWLKILRKDGFVPYGTWGNGQKNRPLNALIKLGAATLGFGPKGSGFCLQEMGYLSTEK